MTSRFQDAMRLMRRHDPQLQEEGFQLLLGYAAEHLDELLAAFAAEHNDHGLRCWLLELIGQARSERALPILAGYLGSTDKALRDRAVQGLKYLDTREARQALYQARANR